MFRSFYLNLALGGIRKNAQFYGPYILMNCFIIAMYYIMHSIANSEGLRVMSGGADMKMILTFGIYVIGIFAVLAVFYTNSFLMKRRKKEIGVYNILGLAKRHIARMMGLETILVAIICLAAGLVGGMLFGKLLYILFITLLGFPVTLGFKASMASVLSTVVLFSVIFGAILLYNLARIHLANPIELVRESAVGEREPKTKWLMTGIGVVSLATGYGISLAVKSPLQAMTLFFVAVVLVMIGTYSLFTTGSIVLLKALRGNKGYYYQTRHFAVISGMLYRMKQNAVGLANICILSTMVIISLTTTISLYAGLDDTLLNRYPKELIITVPEAKAGVEEAVRSILRNVAKEQGVEITEEDTIRSMMLLTKQEGEKNNLITLDEKSYDQDTVLVQMITYGNYKALMEANRFDAKASASPVADSEALLFCTDMSFGLDQLTIQGQNVQVKEELKILGDWGKDKQDMVPTVILVMKDEAAIQKYYGSITQKPSGNFDLGYEADVIGSEANKKAFGAAAKKALTDYDHQLRLESRTLSKESFFMIYGGFLFLGLFLGALFLVMTVLIMYYKQVSEGFDDKNRYATMQKVGMSHLEIKKAIQSQTVLVFFLPLVTTGIHVAFAFNVINRLLAIFSFTNTPLFILCTVVTVAVFAGFYYIIYRLTARTYFKLVRWS